jgi:hypothetical protein
MSIPAENLQLETQIAAWRDFLRRNRAIHSNDLAELEDHLRDQVGELSRVGLSGDEAFLIAVKRMGNLDALSLEFAREHSERLWKQLVIAPEQGAEPAGHRHELPVVVLLALLAALAVKLPALLGWSFAEQPGFYPRNIGLFVLPVLSGYFAWKRRLGFITCGWLLLAFIAAAAFVNGYPYPVFGDTAKLAAIHLPIAAWLIVGAAYTSGRWFQGNGRMNFVRFTGELFIYYVLIILGGGVLTAFTALMLTATHVENYWLLERWMVPCGSASAVIVGAWLVEAKQSVIENMAPVLTKLFTPLFTLLLLGFIVLTFGTGRALDVDRDMLIGFDLLLALVVALVLYTASARDFDAPPDVSDKLQFTLIVSALVVDAMALAAISSRISEFGFSPNRVAALGENLILLANLGGSAWFYARFLRRRGTIAALERWQVAYLPVYSIWAAFVVIGFPPLFEFR